MTDPAPSSTRLLLEIQDQHAARVRAEQALATASRNANIGAAGVLLGVVVFWFSSWYLLAILLFIGGLLMWIGGASGRGNARRELAEIDGKLEGLKAQVQ